MHRSVATSSGRLALASREAKLSGPNVTSVDIATARLTSVAPADRWASTNAVTSHSWYCAVVPMTAEPWAGPSAGRLLCVIPASVQLLFGTPWATSVTVLNRTRACDSAGTDQQARG